jgi:hypothetical protein
MRVSFYFHTQIYFILRSAGPSKRRLAAAPQEARREGREMPMQPTPADPITASMQVTNPRHE